MKEIPILFSTPMVQAILEGRKTMTRRIINPKTAMFDIAMHKDGSNKWPRNLDEDERFVSDMVCPHGQVGDVLWVRETSCYVIYDHAHDLLEGSIDRNQWVYKASIHPDWMEYAKEKYGYKWKPAIHMLKDACRIKLRITNIRVERLNDISEEDAIAEGILAYNDGTFKNYFTQKGLREIDGVECLLPIGSFQSLWCSINGIESWQENPWVWVITFKRINN